MLRRHRWVERGASREQVFHRAEQIGQEHVGKLLTVTATPTHESRGHLVSVRPWSVDDLLGGPGAVVLYLRARRGHRASAPQWKLVVPPNAPVLVHHSIEKCEEQS